MGLSSPLRKLDDRFLGDRFRGQPAKPAPTPAEDDDRQVERRSRERVGSPSSRGSGNGVRKTLGIIYLVSRVVFALLALTVLLGLVFTLAPSNPDNVIVRNVLDVAEIAAGPFKDLFTVADKPERQVVVNYAVAVVLYMVASILVTSLPGSDH